MLNKLKFNPLHIIPHGFLAAVVAVVLGFFHAIQTSEYYKTEEKMFSGNYTNCKLIIEKASGASAVCDGFKALLEPKFIVAAYFDKDLKINCWRTVGSRTGTEFNNCSTEEPDVKQ